MEQSNIGKKGNRMKSIMTLVVLSLLVVSCADQGSDQANIEDGTYCFQEVYQHQNAEGLSDVLELELTIQGNKAEGIFNWLPAEKDKRVGALAGELEGNKVNATYASSQEGVRQETNLTIELSAGKAIVVSDNKNSVFDAEITKVDCKKR